MNLLLLDNSPGQTKPLCYMDPSREDAEKNMASYIRTTYFRCLSEERAKVRGTDIANDCSIRVKLIKPALLLALIFRLLLDPTA